MKLALRLGVEVEVLFEGDLDLKGLIEGQEDGPHSAFAQRTINSIPIVKDRTCF
jgi:hypothetical protein